jgi:4-amino-4-deoxy-L-arabinose transferase-like glycosyltransferase
MSVDHRDDRSGGVWPGLIAAVLLLALARLALTGLMPLMDTSEARYADIARQMVERSDWTTPWFRDGSPFWGKPPLAFWLSAIGFKVFGFNEFGARAPHWLLAVFIAALVWWQARQHSRRAAWHAACLLSGSALFLTLSGAVLTDMALALGNALVMLGTWRALADPRVGQVPAEGGRLAGGLIALGAIIGLLAKGPVAILLCAIPVLGWALWTRRLGLLWHRVAWVQVSLLVAAVVMPWYVLAEIRTPGFLEYFIVGEHWHRFLTAGWQGDLYGSAHIEPRGTIWLFAMFAALPWTVLAPLVWWRATSRLREQGELQRLTVDTMGAMPKTHEVVYLVAWALSPMVVFTAAGNILWTYVLPGLPAAALVAARFTARLPEPRRTDIALAAVLTGCCLTIILGSYALHRDGTFERRSTAWVVELVEQQPKGREAPLLYFGDQIPFSLSFYSNRRARLVNSRQALEASVRCSSAFVATPIKMADTLVAAPGQSITKLGASQRHVLLRMDWPCP